MLLFGAVVLGASAPAAAQSIDVEVRTIAASAEGSGVDDELEDIEGKLARGFTGYTRFEHLGTETFSLSVDEKKMLELPADSSVTFTFYGLAGELIKLGLGVADKMNTTLRASPGSTFFHAGLKYRDGILVLAISVVRDE